MWGIRIIYREWNLPRIRCDSGMVSELERIVAICCKGGSVTRENGGCMDIPLGRGCENWLMAAVSEANHLSTGKYAPLATPPTTVALQPRLPPDYEVVVQGSAFSVPGHG